MPEQDNTKDAPATAEHSGKVVHYVGDPMCSWCWGISPTIGAIASYCEEQSILFKITMGGLRAGGGDEWNEDFKSFLRNEWQHIAQVTGQPFGYELLEVPNFNYDTEPACRAVTTVKILRTRNNLPQSIVLTFFAAIQHKFYVGGQDTKTVSFYASICADLGIDFDEFQRIFDSPEARQAVDQEFVRTRQLGVCSFPTLLLKNEAQTTMLAEGFVTTEQALSRLRNALGACAN